MGRPPSDPAVGVAYLAEGSDVALSASGRGREGGCPPGSRIGACVAPAIVFLATLLAFYPALWRRQTIVAYSAAGYAPKSWTLPPGWGGVTAVDLYEATPETYTKVTSVPATANGEISFGMSAGQELVLVPAGTPLAP